MALLSASSLNNRFTQLVIATIFLLGIVWFWVPSLDVGRHISDFDISSVLANANPRPKPHSKTPPVPIQPTKHHPIDDLIRRAEEEHATLLGKEARSLSDAVRAYKARRGRQPPPNFDRWYNFAREHSALIVEDFFDRIYDDLRPFWGVSAKQMRDAAKDYRFTVSVRGGKASSKTDQFRDWMSLWEDLVKSIAPHLPDLDMPINEMDESRMIVPWEEIERYLEKERTGRRIVPANELKKTAYGDLKDLDEHPPEKFDPQYDRMGPYWQLAVVGCHPESPARKAYIETDFTSPPPLTGEFPKGSYEGYVQNWTLATSPCDKPELQSLHGTFVEPISISTTKRFFPLFGGSKLPMNNEILLPPAMYWTSDPFYSGGEDHGPPWEEKKDVLIWRGAASGGRNRDNNWTRFQRHRFVSMVNATSVRAAETVNERPPNFALAPENAYSLSTYDPERRTGALADWVETWSDAAVVHLLCFPAGSGPGDSHCPYTDHYFSVAKGKPMKEQYENKFLPDIDGNSFSGRYRGFLGSTSLPIKATIYNEWHDSRLIPWKHFVPMDNTFADIYGIMEYFLGNPQVGLGGRDDAARSIALEGKSWTETVLRREDMQIYVYRLLLEYARLCDDDREVMGFHENESP